MTVNGKRRFKGNDGHRYFVQNSAKADAYKGKYILTREVGNFWKLCYGGGWNVLHFDTIKDAQRLVLLAPETIEMW